MASIPSSFNTTIGVQTLGPQGVSGIRGPVGVAGAPGIRKERYMLAYSGLPFEVILKPDTFAMIEDATKVNGDELSFIKMVDVEEWEVIREAWATAWTKRKAYSAFEYGEMPDE